MVNAKIQNVNQISLFLKNLKGGKNWAIIVFYVELHCLRLSN